MMFKTKRKKMVRKRKKRRKAINKSHSQEMEAGLTSTSGNKLLMS